MLPTNSSPPEMEAMGLESGMSDTVLERSWGKEVDVGCGPTDILRTLRPVGEACDDESPETSVREGSRSEGLFTAVLAWISYWCHWLPVSGACLAKEV
mmetsp:Transcript_1817/g.5070  ORF Transcript_1817/g.5070 Transcript_1817/m.5070 type:complete len:98 (-) Transcript_1817:235-528(-)